MPFSLNYQDYLRNAPGLNASENAVTPMSQAEWDALPMEQQWGLLGNGSQGISVNQYDPRYQGLIGDGSSGGSRNAVSVLPGSFGSNYRTNDGVQRFQDPSQVHQYNGYYTAASDNETAAIQRQGGLSDRQWGLLAATLLGGGAAIGGLGGGVAAPGMSTSIGGGFGTGALGSGGTGASFGTAFSAANAAGGAAGGMPSQLTGPPASQANFGLDPMEPLPTGSGVGNLGPTPSFGGSGLLGTAGDYLGQAGSWIANNPIRALGLVQTGAGLLNRNGGGSPSGGGSSVSKGGGGTPMPGSAQQGPSNFYVNPYTLAQLQRSYQ